MLHFVGNAAERPVAELCGLAAEFRHIVAHRTGATAQYFSYATQGGGDHVTDMIDGLRRTRGGTAANSFQAPLKRAQALFDVVDAVGDGTGISGSRKHGCCRRDGSCSILMGTVEPGVDLAVSLVLGHAVTLLQSAVEF